jgi:hypothetical protein
VSRAADGKVMFGEYLPDLPVTDNPGLTEALNVLPVDKFYRAYHPIAGAGTALADDRAAPSPRRTRAATPIYTPARRRRSISARAPRGPTRARRLHHGDR